MATERRHQASPKKLVDTQTRNKAILEKPEKMLAECFSTPAGIWVLNYLMKETGFNGKLCVVSADTSRFMPEETAYNTIRRSVYMNIRDILMKNHSDVVQKAEFMIEPKE